MLRQRTAFRTDAILASLRGRLIGGDLRPGDRLPTRSELERSFGASRATIQEVFDRLAADGFIAASGRNGTCVVEHPPHLHRVALVAPWATPAQSWFWFALQRAAQARGADPELTIAIHAGIEPRADNVGHAVLRREVEAGRLAGIIFAAPPAALVDADLPGGLPRVAIMRGRCPDGAPTIYPSEEAFSSRAVEHLAGRGRRRIALIGADDAHVRHHLAALAAHGLEPSPWLVQTVPLTQSGAARNCANLLMRCAAADRPDALVIADDNLVGHATAGVRDAGGQDLIDIVGHCNFPWPTPSALPIRRLGYDARDILDRCLATIVAQRAGRRPRDVSLAPVFDDEVAPVDADARWGS